MPCMSTTRQKGAGFTLVEVLIIAPVVILVISSFIGLIITMVGDVMAIRDRNNMAYEIRDTLDRIEQDSRLSTQFLLTTGTLLAPQGSDSNFTGTAAFTNSNSLIMGTLTTDKNPADSTRQIIYYAKQPNDCGALQAYNRPFIAKVVYFLNNGSLWRRSYLFNYNTNATPNDETLCGAPWQQNSCSPGYTGARCQTNDVEVMKNVSSFNVKYYSSPSSTTEIGSANALNATTIEVTINGSKTVVGRSITNSGALRASKLNSIDADLPLPATPTLSVTSNNANGATFSWPLVPSATSYLVSYNINGGSWVDATNDSTTLSYTVSANRKDTVTLKVAARNSTGTSAYATTAFTIPDWNTCSLQNSWGNVGGAFATAGFTKTSTEVVQLKGHITGSNLASGTVLCYLPDGFRPTAAIMFQVPSSSSGAVRVDVNAGGAVYLGDNLANGTWLSLNNIRFIASTASYSVVAPTFQNSWVNYGGGYYSDLQLRKDSLNRVHVQGLIKGGTMSDLTPFAALPAGYRPSEYYHLPVRSNAPFNYMGVSTTNMQYKTITGAGVNAYYAPVGMFYISGAGTWTNLTLQSSWVAYGGTTGTSPQYTKSSDGIVTVKGLIKNGTTTANTIIANLPVGYRPKETLRIHTVSTGAAGYVDIDASGNIRVGSLTNTSASLDPITFMAEQ